MSYYLLPHELGVDFLDELREFTVSLLAKHYPGRPTTPGGRVKPWRDGKGPVGACLHYDAATSGWGTVAWGLWNASNTNSSWHATVFDGMTERAAEFLEQTNQKFALLRLYMPALALLHAHRDKGTWNCNWANALLFGVEQRNLGPLFLREGRYVSIQGDRFVAPLRAAVRAGKLHWEPYTLEQILTTVNICRALRGWRGGHFRPEWVLPHHCIWWTKSDPGFAYPMHQVRKLIFLDDERIHDTAAILEDDGFALPTDAVSTEVCSTDTPCDDAGAFDPEQDIDELASFVQRQRGAESREAADPGSEYPDFERIDRVQLGWRQGLPKFRAQAYAFQYHVAPVAEPAMDPFEVDALLAHAALVFQKSTLYSKVPTLTRDSIPGLATQAALEKRLAAYM